MAIQERRPPQDEKKHFFKNIFFLPATVNWIYINFGLICSGFAHLSSLLAIQSKDNGNPKLRQQEDIESLGNAATETDFL